MAEQPSPPLIKDFDSFARVHAFLLAASGLPASLHRPLYAKLAEETFDGGEFFSVEPCDGGRQRRLVLAADAVCKESDLFLVDHAWSFRLPDALKQLREVPGLAERMAALMCVDSDREDEEGEGEGEEEEGEKRKLAFEIVEKELNRVKEKEKDSVSWLEFEELGIDDEMLLSLDSSSKFPNLVALNLWGNKLQDSETVLKEISKCKNLKALWLNENPALQNKEESISKAIIDAIPGLEIYNSKCTDKFGAWALGFCGGLIGSENLDFSLNSSIKLGQITSLDLSNRSIHKLPEVFSPDKIPCISHLNIKGNPFDQVTTHELLNLLSKFPSLKEIEVDIPGPLGERALHIIESLPNLSTLNKVSTSEIIESGKLVIYTELEPRFPEWSATDPVHERVISAMWRYLMTYRLADEQKIDETPVWYVMDELGSALRHSDNANFRVAPFLFMPQGDLNSAISYSIMWPIKDVKQGEECTRDFLFGIDESKQRSARLTAWFHTPQNYFIHEYEKYKQELESKALVLNKSENQTEKEKFITKSILSSDKSVLKVYTDNPQVEEFLTRPEFTLTDEPKEADIIWTGMQVDSETKKELGLSEEQYINQFPFEACLVMKHHLAETIHKALGSPDWLQPTYNLESELTQLIGDYFTREKNQLNNLWIAKPWNLARTIDTTVTDNISEIIRLMETGPKICQKYIERPSLFKGKKFDLRYMVLVRSFEPLEIFLSDVFWVRLANNDYTLEKNSLFEYETHFTVMNYIGKLKHKNTPEFVKEFEEEHQVNWLEIHERIRKMIRCVFESAATVQPEIQNPKSRAIYGIDVMLDNNFMPKLLEVTYCPDCNRACKYDTQAVVGNGDVVQGKEFFNSVFGCLFLDESTNVSPL
ncbi:hypothetical protein LUZ60_005639 [Juncus effusus]|nr:hypothetical protein LUZ60_005639 [Juncus effusus]